MAASAGCQICGSNLHGDGWHYGIHDEDAGKGSSVLHRQRDFGPPVSTPPPRPNDERIIEPIAPYNGYDGEQVLADLPPTPWVVEGLQIAPGRPTLLAAYGATGKTMALQSMMVSLALGRKVWGKFATGKDGVKVIHFDYEQGLHATFLRYQRLLIGMRLDRTDKKIRAAFKENLRVHVFPGLYLDARAAESELIKLCTGVTIAVIDSLRAMVPGIDENDSVIRRFIDILTRVSQATGCAFIVIHHSAKIKDDDNVDPRYVVRGSSAIFDACGCVYAMMGSRGEPKKVLQVKTPADGKGSGVEPFELCIEDVEAGGDKEAGVAVVHQEPTVEQEMTPVEHLDAVKRNIISVIQTDKGLKTTNAVIARLTVKARRELRLQAFRELIERGTISDGPKGFTLKGRF